MSWPVDNLVAHYCACQCQPAPRPRDGLYQLALSETHRFGLRSEDDGALLLFAHPRPVAALRPQDGPSDEAHRTLRDLELGEDEFATWWLRVNRSLSHSTVWTRVPQVRIGHAEFAVLVARLRERTEVWAHVLGWGAAPTGARGGVAL
jgi:hypothetical protein